MSWRDLGEDERLTYLVGAVTRADVSVEALARRLGSEVPTQGKWPRELGRQLQRLSDALPAMSVSAELSVAGLAALEHAKLLHDERNRYVHDGLLRAVKGGFLFRWNMDAPRPASINDVAFTLEDIERCLAGLEVSRWRLTGLFHLLHAERTGAEHIPLWCSLVTGEFVINERGGISTG